MQAATQAVDKLKNRRGLGLENSLHHQLAGRIQNSDGDRCLVHIQPNILGIIHQGAPGCRLRCERSKPTSKGRPFIMRLPGLDQRRWFRKDYLCKPIMQTQSKWLWPVTIANSVVFGTLLL